MNESKEPDVPAGRRPHRDRVKDIADLLKVGKTGGICIDNTEEHKAFYLHELSKYPKLNVVYQGNLTKDTYLIKVERLP